MEFDDAFHRCCRAWGEVHLASAKHPILSLTCRNNDRTRRGGQGRISSLVRFAL
jgi:hypothetical protein